MAGRGLVVPDEPVMVVPDIHQDVDFLERIIEETGLRPLGGLVFLGDVLDGRNPTTRTSAMALKTLQLLEELHTGPIPVVQLWGNHDWIYWQHRELSFQYAAEPTDERRQTLEQFDLRPETALAFAESTESFWKRCGLVHVVNGVLLSHAGVHRSFWEFDQSVEVNVSILNSAFEASFNAPSGTPDRAITACGIARGGDCAHGSPIWQDWEAEFEDLLPCPQIVGHSSGRTIRQRGRSWCIDIVQASYALVYPDGGVEPVALAR